MTSPSTQFVTSRRMNIYEPFHQINTWVEGYHDDECPDVSPLKVIELEEKLFNQSEDALHGALTTSNKYDQEACKPIDKVQRRLAQNRKLHAKAVCEKRPTQQDLYVGGVIDHLPFAGTINSGIAEFEMEYGHWVEEQNRQICELRTALHAHITDKDLQNLVDNSMSHYFDLFRMKATAAKADVFYLTSGMWKTSAERFFLWIGGFRPSELLKVLVPQLDPLTDQQVTQVCNLQQSCQQAEDALSQGMDRLQETLAETVAAGRLGEGNYVPQMTNAVEKLDALVSFVNQADHLRKETLQQMHRILTKHQAARGLLALGEYFQRLRALSSFWASRPHEPA
ncbi:hypothetical protein Nepgr_026040 [Nepenthes gracilis]|uniref:DOG1 domain-containing protein n=1 Tax=Nepenthes gracilis TaxID=150966 RepID=A0AAD3T8Y6_NEPGR|nr:hypothetical protein Nepgr_026040 [Nepenthes gracilis]